MHKAKSLLIIIISSLALFSCTKTDEDADANTCSNMRHLRITATTPVTIGQEIKMSVPEVGGYRLYNWSGPDNFNNYQYPDYSIGYAELKHEGWYYVSVSNSSCEIKVDSVYIDVKLPQGTPSCTVANNNTTYSNLFDDSYTSVTKGIEPTLALKSLSATGNGNMIIYFHHYWRTAEPEDGIYTTINTPLFEQFDANYNKVYITTTKGSIYWGSHENQQVYVSHVNGKLQVRFCNLNMSGYNGTSYFTSASGNVLEL
jgi:hypothetical protein